MRGVRTRGGCISLLALVVLPSLGRAQQPFHRGGALDPTAAVRLFSMAGSVTVTGWDRDSIDVRGTVGAGLEPVAGGTRTGWKMSTYDGRQRADAPSHLVVRVPRRAQLWIKTTSASITVSQVDGSLDLYTIEGPIDVRGAPRELTAETMRGAVAIRGTPGWVRAKSGTGDVAFDGTAQDVALSTVGGRISSSTRFTRGRFESVRGAIALHGPFGGTATADVDSHAGAVELHLDAKSSAAITAYTLTGAITNTLTNALPRTAKGSGSELAFTIGDGRARLMVRTYSGNISLFPPKAVRVQ